MAHELRSMRNIHALKGIHGHLYVWTCETRSRLRV